MTELRWLALLRGGPSECFEERPVQRVNIVLSRGVLALEAELACVRRSLVENSQRRTVEKRNFLNRSRGIALRSALDAYFDSRCRSATAVSRLFLCNRSRSAPYDSDRITRSNWLR
jgi:hypothetical protein